MYTLTVQRSDVPRTRIHIGCWEVAVDVLHAARDHGYLVEVRSSVKSIMRPWDETERAEMIMHEIMRKA